MTTLFINPMEWVIATNPDECQGCEYTKMYPITWDEALYRSLIIKDGKYLYFLRGDDPTILSLINERHNRIGFPDSPISEIGASIRAQVILRDLGLGPGVTASNINNWLYSNGHKLINHPRVGKKTLREIKTLLIKTGTACPYFNYGKYLI